MFRARRLAGRVLTVILVGTALTLGAATAAQAAPQCHDTGCNSLDPIAAGCANDAETLEFKSDHGTTIQLRYSPSCNAAWVKAIYPME